MRLTKMLPLMMSALCAATCFGSVARSADGGPPEAFAIHGSNTIGARLMPALVEAYAASVGANALTLAGSQPEEVELKLQTKTGATFATVGIQSHGSGTAVPSLISGKALVGMLSRYIEDKEVEALKAAGIADVRATPNEHVLALDGVLVLVSPGNSLNALSMEQLAGIFSGTITDWAALGREPGRIQVYARDGKSGTFDTFNSLVLKPRKAALAPDARRFESSEELSDSVARDPNGIGFAGFAYLRNAKALAVINDCGIAHEPSAFNVKTEQYPLSRRLYLYTNAVPKGSVAEKIVEFALSPAAQEIIRAHGFIDQNIDLSDQNDQVLRLADGLVALDAGVDPLALKELASNLKYSARLSTTLQFQLASTRLDSKAMADVGRIAGFIETLAKSSPGKAVTLAGFTDSVGDFAANRALSRARAEQAKGELLRALGPGIQKSLLIARGYGKLLPTNCNTTKEGRNRNRRVEVWVK
jgi:phosphate transport system substrate-binding protein